MVGPDSRAKRLIYFVLYGFATRLGLPSIKIGSIVCNMKKVALHSAAKVRGKLYGITNYPQVKTIQSAAGNS
jgi:hypothetical protein